MILLAIGVYHGLANRSEEQKTKESAAINPNPNLRYWPAVDNDVKLV
jgi:hypothetical protein